MALLSLPKGIRSLLEKTYLIEEEETLQDILDKIDNEFLDLEVRDVKTPKEFADKILKITKKYNFVEKMSEGDDVKKLTKIVTDAFEYAVPETIFKKGLAIVRNTIRDLYDNLSAKRRENPNAEIDSKPEILGKVSDKQTKTDTAPKSTQTTKRRKRKTKSTTTTNKTSPTVPEPKTTQEPTSDVDKIEKHLGIKETTHGLIHVDSLILPKKYPDYLKLPNPEAVKNQLKTNGINTIPIIIRPVVVDDEEMYEVVYGKEVVEFARELGIKNLQATKVNIKKSEVPKYQEELANNLGISVSNSPEKNADLNSPPAETSTTSNQVTSQPQQTPTVQQNPSSTDSGESIDINNKEEIKRLIDKVTKFKRGNSYFRYIPSSAQNKLIQNTVNNKSLLEIIAADDELKKYLESLYKGGNKEKEFYKVFGNFYSTNKDVSSAQAPSQTPQSTVQPSEEPSSNEQPVDLSNKEEIKRLIDKVTKFKRGNSYFRYIPSSARNKLIQNTVNNKSLLEIIAADDELKKYLESLYKGGNKEKEFYKVFGDFSTNIPKVKTSTADTPTSQATIPSSGTLSTEQIKAIIDGVFSKPENKSGAIAFKKVPTELGRKITDTQTLGDLIKSSEELKQHFLSYYKPEKVGKMGANFVRKTLENYGKTSEPVEQPVKSSAVSAPKPKSNNTGKAQRKSDRITASLANKTFNDILNNIDDIEGSDYEEFVDDDELEYDIDDEIETPILPKTFGKTGSVKTEKDREKLENFIDDILWNNKSELGNMEKNIKILQTSVDGERLVDILRDDKNLKKYFISFYTGRAPKDVIEQVSNIIDTGNIPSVSADIEVPYEEPPASSTEEFIEPSPEETVQIEKEIEKDVLEKSGNQEEPSPEEVVQDLEDKNLIKGIAQEPQLIKKYKTVFLSNDAYKDFYELVKDIILKRFPKSPAAKKLRLLPPAKEVVYKGVLRRKNRKTRKEPLITPYREPEKQTLSLPSSTENYIKIKADLNRIINDLSTKISNNEKINTQEISNKINNMNITKEYADEEVIEKLYKIYRFIQTYIENKEKEIEADKSYLISVKSKIDSIEGNIEEDFVSNDILNKVRNELNINPKLTLDTITKAEIESTIDGLEELVDKLESKVGRRVRFTPSAKTKYRDLISKVISIATNNSKYVSKQQYNKISELLDKLLILNKQNNNILKECVKLAYLMSKTRLILKENKKKVLNENIIQAIINFLGKILGAFSEGFFGAFSDMYDKNNYDRYGWKWYYGTPYQREIQRDFENYSKQTLNKNKASEKEIKEDVEKTTQIADELISKVENINNKRREEVTKEDLALVAQAKATAQIIEEEAEDFDSDPLKILFKNLSNKLKESTEKFKKKFGKLFEKIKNKLGSLKFDFSFITDIFNNIKNDEKVIITNNINLFNKNFLIKFKEVRVSFYSAFNGMKNIIVSSENDNFNPIYVTYDNKKYSFLFELGYNDEFVKIIQNELKPRQYEDFKEKLNLLDSEYSWYAEKIEQIIKSEDIGDLKDIFDSMPINVKIVEDFQVENKITPLKLNEFITEFLEFIGYDLTGDNRDEEETKIQQDLTGDNRDSEETKIQQDENRISELVDEFIAKNGSLENVKTKFEEFKKITNNLISNIPKKLREEFENINDLQIKRLSEKNLRKNNFDYGIILEKDNDFRVVLLFKQIANNEIRNIISQLSTIGEGEDNKVHDLVEEFYKIEDENYKWLKDMFFDYLQNEDNFDSNNYINEAKIFIKMIDHEKVSHDLYTKISDNNIVEYIKRLSNSNSESQNKGSQT